MISKKTCDSRRRPKNLPTSKSPGSNAAATSASSKGKSSASPSLPDSALDVGRWAFDVFPNAFSRQALHPRPRRSFHENLGRFLETDDRPSRRSVSRALPLNSSAAADFVRNKAARFSFHLLGLGRDGGRDP